MLRVLNALLEKAGARRTGATQKRKVARQDLERLFHDDFAAHALIVKERKAAAAKAA